MAIERVLPFHANHSKGNKKGNKRFYDMKILNPDGTVKKIISGDTLHKECLEANLGGYGAKRKDVHWFKCASCKKRKLSKKHEGKYCSSCWKQRGKI